MVPKVAQLQVHDRGGDCQPLTTEAPHFCPKCMTAMAAKMNLHGSLCVPLQILCHERNWNEDLSGPSSDPCPRAVGP
jgi:hypothetical protein